MVRTSTCNSKTIRNQIIYKAKNIQYLIGIVTFDAINAKTMNASFVIKPKQKT